MTESVCSVDECERDARTRGWCTLHYDRWRKFGEPGQAALKRVAAYGRDARCEVAGCTHRPTNRHLCDAHYQRLLKYGDTGAPEVRVGRSLDNPDGTRTCMGCRVAKPLDAFHIDRMNPRGRRSKCKECRKAAVRDWYSANRDEQVSRQRASYLRDPDRHRRWDNARYRRDKPKRVARAKEGVHRRRVRIAKGYEPGVNVDSLRVIHGDNCPYCGCMMSFVPVPKGGYDPTRATVEHKVPISRGGLHTFDNTCLACWRCNQRKNARRLTEWEFVDGHWQRIAESVSPT